MNRVRQAMDRAASENRAALVVYLTHGDPNLEVSAEILIAAANAGADVIELGVPFSDPNADGPVIEAAMLRALAAGGSLTTALEAVAAFRQAGHQTPVVLFGYYNPIFCFGVDAFAAAAASAGVDAVLTVDVPVDELAEVHGPLAAKGVGVIPLVAPTSGDGRIAKVAPFQAPFVYYISMTGITGAAFRGDDALVARVADVKALTGAPVAVGFGIKTPVDVARVAAFADGVVVGSAIVAASRAATDAGESPAAVVGLLVGALRAACARAPSPG